MPQLPRWALPAGAAVVAGGGLLYLRRRRAAMAAGGSSGAATGTSTGYTTGNAAVDNGSAYGAPLPVSVLPPITFGPPSGTTDSSAVSPTPAVPSGGPTVNNTPTPPPPPQPITSTPQPAKPPCDPPTGLKMLPGEQFVTHLDAPNGGCWWLSNYGGIFAMNGAPFYGAALPNRFGPSYPDNRTAVSLLPLGQGYQVISNKGETYNYPG